MRVHPALLALAFAACLDDQDAGPASACPLDQPVRLAAFAGPRDARMEFMRFGERLLYYYWVYEQPINELWLLDRCGGEPEHQVWSVGLQRLIPLVTGDRVLLYGQDENDRFFFLDRLDEPGLDEPRPILGLPDQKLEGYSRGDDGFYFSSPFTGSEPRTRAAGIGVDPIALYIHHGDPSVPVVHLGDQIARTIATDGRMWIHDDNGDLRDVDPRTGESTLVLTGVRFFAPVPTTRRVSWQQLGDDLAEPIFVHDRDTGEDIPIAVNDFTAVSWNRVEHLHRPQVGTWHVTPDGAYAALYGPEHRVAAVVRTDTGAAVTPPANARLRGLVGDDFNLVLDDDDDHVLVRWDPRTGDLREWFRRPLAEFLPVPFEVADDHLLYITPDSSTSATLWRVDLTTGERALELPRTGFDTRRLADGRYVTTIPSYSDFTYESLVFDPETELYTTIAADIRRFDLDPEFGQFYIVDGAEPGLWVAPIPPR